MSQSVSGWVGDWTDEWTCPGCLEHGVNMLSFKVSLTLVSEQMVEMA